MHRQRLQVHRIAANKSLGCAAGYCGLEYFSPCGTALALAESQFSGVTVGAPFACRWLLSSRVEQPNPIASH